MPELVTFLGRPVKRRRRLENGISLTLVSPVPGKRGLCLVVSQEEWLRYGKVQFYQKREMPDPRAIARQFLT